MYLDAIAVLHCSPHDMLHLNVVFRGRINLTEVIREIFAILDALHIWP